MSLMRVLPGLYHCGTMLKRADEDAETKILAWKATR